MLGDAEDAAVRLMHPGTVAFEVQVAMARITAVASLEAFPRDYGLGLEMQRLPDYGPSWRIAHPRRFCRFPIGSAD